VTEHTTAKLARALSAVPGVPAEMIAAAIDGLYHDYLSPLDCPSIQLVRDLRDLARAPATPRRSRLLLKRLSNRVVLGEFDASKEEADEWAASAEGQQALAEFLNPGSRP
jgi:hypothetical protein